MQYNTGRAGLTLLRRRFLLHLESGQPLPAEECDRRATALTGVLACSSSLADAIVEA